MSKENPNELKIINKNERLKYINLLDKYKQQIADLEAKLAENRKWLASNEGFLENQKLKQQLAEKDKEIEELKYELEWAKNDVNESAVGHKQWVIEELEKIKYKFREVYDKKRKHYLSVVKCYELVDEQIKQLTHQHEDKGE